MEKWSRLLLSPVPLPNPHGACVSPFYGQVLVVVYKCLSIHPPHRGDLCVIFYVSASHLYRSAPLTKNQKIVWNFLLFVFTNVKLKSWFGYLKKKREDNANRQRSKNPTTTPSGGWSMNPLFSGPYLLNTWSTEFSYHEIVHMIYMVDNMEHFNCAHACWFLHNVPTESDDERIISCSLCRAISLLLCQKKKKGLGDTEA